MSHQVSDLGWDDFDLDVPPISNSHQPKHNRGDSGIAKIKVNPTQSEAWWLTLYSYFDTVLQKFDSKDCENRAKCEHRWRRGATLSDGFTCILEMESNF